MNLINIVKLAVAIALLTFTTDVIRGDLPQRDMPTLKTIGSDSKKQQSWGGEESKFLRRAPWRKLRHQKLIQDPLCEICNKEGKVREANIVDHHRPRRFWPEYALTIENLTSMCKQHHNKKTKIESSIFSKEEWIQVFSNHPDFKK